jgi:hypothetical protein
VHERRFERGCGVIDRGARASRGNDLSRGNTRAQECRNVASRICAGNSDAGPGQFSPDILRGRLSVAADVLVAT